MLRQKSMKGFLNFLIKALFFENFDQLLQKKPHFFGTFWSNFSEIRP